MYDASFVDESLSACTNLQEEIKEVFEGSCDLLHVKLITKECIKVADEFIPELVDTLASQMDPQVVCSVAGLCNNERYIKMLADAGEVTESKVIEKPTTCSGCQTVMTVVERKFRQATRDQVLQGLLQVLLSIKL